MSDEPEADTPWFVRVALGGVAWLGGAFLLGFLAWAVGEDGALPVGLLLLVASMGLRHLAPPFLRDFWVQTSLLGMVAARGAIGIGMDDLFDERAAYFALFCVEIAALLAYPGSAARLVSVVCGLSWLAAWMDAPFATEALAVTALAAAAGGSTLQASARESGLASLWEPLVIGGALWSLAGLAGSSPGWHGSHPWLASLGVGIVGAVIAARWLSDGGASPVTWAAAGAAAAALCAIGASVPGTLAGLVSSGLAFRAGNRLWLGASLAGLCAHGVYLYWQMDTSFAVKGGSMIGLGVVLLAISRLAHRREA